MYVNTDKLKCLREAKKINQFELAEKLFISRSAYSKIESGKTAIHLEIALKLAYHLGCSICDFVDIPAMYMNISVNGITQKYIDQSLMIVKIFELIDQIKIKALKKSIRNTSS